MPPGVICFLLYISDSGQDLWGWSGHFSTSKAQHSSGKPAVSYTSALFIIYFSFSIFLLRDAWMFGPSVKRVCVMLLN